MTAKGNSSPNADLLLGEVRSIVETALGLGPESIGSTPDSGLYRERSRAGFDGRGLCNHGSRREIRVRGGG